VEDFNGISARFWSHVDRRGPDQCWPWLAATYLGYGRIGIRKRLFQAHRVAYELMVGPIPDGKHIHHRCENRACCNPAHMEPMDPGEHRRMHFGVGCSKHGMEDIRYPKCGGRYCGICNRERVAAWKAERRRQGLKV
jgi:hypothetical protein